MGKPITLNDHAIKDTETLLSIREEAPKLWQSMLQNDRKNPRAIYCGDHEQPNACIIGKPGKDKTIYPIEDETHRFYNPETEKIASKLMELGRIRKDLSEDNNR